VHAQVRQPGCKKVFREVASGAKTDRAQLRRLLDQLDDGDVLTVTRLDRLARSTRDLLNALAAITGKKAGFRSLGDTWADTTTSHGRLMLTVLGGLAEFERDLIRMRTGEGRARAENRPAAKGDQAPRAWRGIPYRDWPQLQRQRGDDFEAQPMTMIGPKIVISWLAVIAAFLSAGPSFWVQPASFCRRPWWQASLLRRLRPKRSDPEAVCHGLKAFYQQVRSSGAR
jgi:hypothetical protein